MGPTAPRPAGLTARGLRLRRGGRVVLDGAGLTVAPGTITALVAPSGAGKSTLLRCLNRLVEPDAGTIELDGRDVRTLDPRALRRQVGLVAQTPTMLPGSVRDNVGYGLGDAGPGAAAALDRTVVAALEAAGLDAGFADRAASALSGGERARVALARAFARDPRFVLLDEPTAALDGGTAAQVAGTLRRLADGGIGVALAVHDLPFARAVADRVVGLDDLPIGGPDGARERDARGLSDAGSPGARARAGVPGDEDPARG